jgi:hypothetical protein
MIMVQALLMAGVAAAQIRSYPLDERCIYTVRLSTSEPTTCVFPGALTSLEGARISARADEQPDVLLSHPPGAEFFSLRALKEGATAALNVVYRGKVYSFRFVADGEPDRAVVFLAQPVTGGKSVLKGREQLVALMARGKQAGRLEANFPDMRSALARLRVAQTTHYRTFTATIEEVVRFEAEDALFFRVRLENTDDEPLLYSTDALAIRVRHEIFPATLTEASGVVPPRGIAYAYLLIAGDAEGGRANLSVRENFTVMVPPA